MKFPQRLVIGAVFISQLVARPVRAQIGLFADRNPSPQSAFGRYIFAVDSRVIIDTHMFDLGGNLLATLHDPEPEAGRSFGSTVSMLGSDKILVGAESNPNSWVPSAAFIFDLEGNLLNSLHDSPELRFWSRALSYNVGIQALGADKMVVADPGEFGAVAKVHLLDLNGNCIQTFQDPSGTPNSFAVTGFGSSTAAVGTDKLAIAAPSTPGWLAPVYLFDFQGHLLNTFRLPAAAGPKLTMPLAPIGEDWLVVGAPYYSPSDESAFEEGHVYLFDLHTGTMRTLASPTPVPQAHFGYAIAALGPNKVAVGDPGIGAVQLFDLQGNLLASYSDPSGRGLGPVVAAAGPDRLLVQGPGHAVSLFQIQVNPAAPILTCSPDLTITCLTELPPAEFTGTVSDPSDPNLKVVLVKEVREGVYPAGAVIRRIFQATNPAGLSQSCTQTITFQPIPGDLNGNCILDKYDLVLLLNGIRGHELLPAYDVNGDGKVDIADARYLVLHYTNPGGEP